MGERDCGENKPADIKYFVLPQCCLAGSMLANFSTLKYKAPGYTLLDNIQLKKVHYDYGFILLNLVCKTAKTF